MHAVQLPPRWSCAYPHLAPSQDGQLYYELNRAIRTRDGPGRAAALGVWGGYLYYLMLALAKLPDVDAVVYRGYPDKATVLQQYKVGRPVQWGAFSSTSTSVQVTKSFTKQHTGVIFRLTLVCGKDVKAYSYFPSEGEVLVSAQVRVTR